MIDEFDIPADAPVDEALVEEAETKLNQLGKDMASNKMMEAQLLQQSAMDGGPSSVQEALVNMMEYCQIGIRRLSERTGIRRKLLTRMLNGEVSISPEAIGKIHTVFSSLKPDLFK